MDHRPRSFLFFFPFFSSFPFLSFPSLQRQRDIGEYVVLVLSSIAPKYSCWFSSPSSSCCAQQRRRMDGWMDRRSGAASGRLAGVPGRPGHQIVPRRPPVVVPAHVRPLGRSLLAQVLGQLLATVIAAHLDQHHCATQFVADPSHPLQIPR